MPNIIHISCATVGLIIRVRCLSWTCKTEAHLFSYIHKVVVQISPAYGSATRFDVLAKGSQANLCRRRCLSIVVTSSTIRQGSGWSTPANGVSLPADKVRLVLNGDSRSDCSSDFRASTS